MAPRDGPALLLALVRHADRDRPVVRDDELLRARAHVRLLRLHGRRAPAAPRQEARHFRDAAAARPDGRRHRRDRPRRPVPDRGRGVLREQDELDPGAGDVLVLLRPLRHLLRRHVRPFLVQGQARLNYIPSYHTLLDISLPAAARRRRVRSIVDVSHAEGFSTLRRAARPSDPAKAPVCSVGVEGVGAP